MEGVCRLLSVLMAHHSRDVRRAARSAAASALEEAAGKGDSSFSALIGRLSDGLSFAMGGGSGPGTLTVRGVWGWAALRVGGLWDGDEQEKRRNSGPSSRF